MNNRRWGRGLLMILLGFAIPFVGVHASAANIVAGPSDYAAKVKTLQPGDTLTLAAGTYGRLSITGLRGRADAWIAISGPDVGEATFEADPCCNTVEITNASYVAIRKLRIDGKDNGGSFGVSAKGGSKNDVHHIRIEQCTLVNHGGSQQQVGISTKSITWGWEIRENTIIGAGTGIYLGNSNGTEAFIGGLIEGNLIVDPVGYCMQIKYQKPRPDVTGVPKTPQQTLIRHNVLIKNDQPSPQGNRPNLLVGGFPESGPGKDDLYHIYGNFIFNNPFESLIQASGRVVIHDNLLVGSQKTALLLRNHDLPLKFARVYHNTIFGGATGVSISGSATTSQLIGNVIFAATAVSGTFAERADNVTGKVTDASAHLAAPSLQLGAMDFYPLAGKCQGTAVDLSRFKDDPDYDKDFNGSSKGRGTFRGAYAGEGANPGWQLQRGLKILQAGPASDGGLAMDQGASPGNDLGVAPRVDASSTADGGQKDARASSDAAVEKTDALDGGCSLVGRGRSDTRLPLMLLLLALLGIRRQRSLG